ncbi:MAG TPA: PfkB family carbohydrate kinase [Candidatus Limnocylindrales bacterium]
MIEAVVIGRIGVDFTPTTPRTTLAAASSFGRAVGGFAGNIGIGLARLGIATAVVSKVGRDGHGDHVRAALTAEGINVTSLGVADDARTQVAFFEAWPPDRFPVTFYRPAPAPDTQLDDADLAAAAVEAAQAVVVSGSLLAEEPARTATLRAMERRAARGRPHEDARGPDRSWTILDLDWRPTLWSQPREYPRLIVDAIGHSDVVIGGDEEFAAAEVPPDVAAARLGEDGLVVLKHGPAGVSLLEHGERHEISGIAVDVTCGLGAGDALTAAFTAGLLRGLPALAALERGNAAGAIVASRLMCSSAMPAPAEINALLATTAAPTRMTRVVA